MIPGAANEIAARLVPGRDLRNTKRAASSSSAMQAPRLVPCGADDHPDRHVLQQSEVA
jgi:hypothetical protein